MHTENKYLFNIDVSYFQQMNDKMKNKILRTFRDFVESEEGQAISKQKNKIGGRIRMYKTKYERDELSAKSALSLLLDLGLVEEIHFKNCEK